MDESQKKIPLPKLIAELCPDGVEFKTLGEIGKFTRGNGLQKKDFTESGVPCIHYGQIYTYYGNFTDRTKSFVSADCAKNLRKAKKGDLIITTTSENLEDVCKCLVWLGDDEVCYGGHSCCFSHNQDPKFIAYFFQTEDFFSQKRNFARGTKVIEIKSADLEKIKIPVPPLEVQREIVRILDKFTELGALLETELVARKKQYGYYREKLLTFSDDVPRVALGEICSKINRVKWQGNNAQFKYIDLSSVDREDHNIKETVVIDKDNAPSRAQQIVEENDILFGTTRPLLKRTAYISKNYDGQICSTGFCVIRVNEQRAFSRFVFHLINAKNFYDYVKANEQGTNYPCISDSKVKDFEIPLPPLPEQKRIADILDRFDALCNDLSSGIPAEIAARKKQYEYYRDRLLTFREKIS